MGKIRGKLEKLKKTMEKLKENYEKNQKMDRKSSIEV